MTIVTDLTALYNNLKNERKEAIIVSEQTPDFLKGRAQGIWNVEERLRQLLAIHGVDPNSIEKLDPLPKSCLSNIEIEEVNIFERRIDSAIHKLLMAKDALDMDCFHKTFSRVNKTTVDSSSQSPSND